MLLQVLVHMLKNDLRGYRPLGPRELKLVCRALEYVDLLPDLDFTGCHPPLTPEAVAQVETQPKVRRLRLNPRWPCAKSPATPSWPSSPPAWAVVQAPVLQAMLLGTAGTGKTTTLKAVLQALEGMNFGGVMKVAYTGVAASNVGVGARTLSDLLRLARVNPTSQQLIPLQGDELVELNDDLQGLQLLVIDEISMVSRTMLAMIDQRLH